MSDPDEVYLDVEVQELDTDVEVILEMLTDVQIKTDFTQTVLISDDILRIIEV